MNMAYLDEEELTAFGFKSLGRNVRISTKASIYNPEAISIGDNSRIDDFCVVSGQVTLGRNVQVSIFCNIAGGKPGVTLEDFATLAAGCHVFAQSDDYSGRTMTNPTIPRRYKKEIMEPVSIGRHVILGTQSVVFPGVSVAEGCATGAHTVVNHSTEPWGIYVGSPARRIKPRDKGLLALEAAYLAEEG